jgi:hypothetical protein
MERMIETFSGRAGGEARKDELLAEQLSEAERFVEETYGSRAWSQTMPWHRRGRSASTCVAARTPTNGYHWSASG